MATTASITRYQMPRNSGEDSFNLLPAMLGAKAWTEFAAKGTTVVFGDHYRAAAMQRGRVDVFVADTAKTDPPAQLVPNADADIFPNTAKDKLLFTISTGTGNGLYVLGL